MSFEEKFNQAFSRLNSAQQRKSALQDRFWMEIEFARHFVDAVPAKAKEWQALIIDAVDQVQKALDSGGAIDAEAVVADAEKILAPIGKAAKQYTVHCCGHAHIDMNWMWDWPETVNVTHDTFITVDKLMDEFPEFHFSHSQASTYLAMEENCPEVFEMLKKRIKEGRWEVIASNWVEGDKNIASGEAMCRHLLYTRRYLKQKFNLDPEDVKIDWSPDTFGHAYTVPSILKNGGVNRYYFHRTGPDYWLFKWKSPDGNEIIAFKDRSRHGYNGFADAQDIGKSLSSFAKETGLKDFLYTYGVGDHGGGPTRKDLRRFRELADWPIFPTVKLSTTDAFFSAVEAAKPKLPVVDEDLNFVFEGCYTSQSTIKRANRISEITMPEAETISCIAGALDGMPYPAERLTRGWQHTLFNHFHDILPGSGVHATYEYSSGLFQEIRVVADTIKTRALRRLASKVDTASAAMAKETTFGAGLGNGLGAGAGDPGVPGGITALNAGAPSAEPILIYNPKPWERTETVYAKVWNKPLEDDKVVVRDSKGNEVKGQVVGKGHYWGHDFTAVAFKAERVPALGYKVYAIDGAPAPVHAEGAKAGRELPDGQCTNIPEVRNGVLENEYLRVELDIASGAIKHLIDRKTGFDYVPEGKMMGVLEACQEMGGSAWTFGPVAQVNPLTTGGRWQVTQRGPNRVSARVDNKYRNSTVSIEIGLNAGSRMVDFQVNTRWVEIGTREAGIPMLRVAFPANIRSGVPTYEIPFGAQSRKQSPQEIPALKWADLSGETEKGTQGITLVNDSKYGHSCDDNTLRLTLIRSTTDPDPLPEVSDHRIKFAIVAHNGAFDVTAATRAGEEFNSPMAVVSASVQDGPLPSEKSFVEMLTPNVFVAAVKKAEDSDALVIRLFDMEGKDTKARLRICDLVNPGSTAVQTDIMEQPLAKNTAKLSGDTLTVTVPAFGQATVKIG